LSITDDSRFRRSDNIRNKGIEMKHLKYLLFMAFLPVVANAVDVKTCYVKINYWNMRDYRFKELNLPVAQNRILAIDVTIVSDAGVYDKLIRSGFSAPPHYDQFPYFNRRGGYWRFNGSTFVMDAGPDAMLRGASGKVYFRNGRHVQTTNNFNRGWIKILHTGNQCSEPQPAVKTKVIAIQNFDMNDPNYKGMIVENIDRWFDGAYGNIKNKILGFTTTVLSNQDNNTYQSRYLTDYTMFPTGCENNDGSGSGCGIMHSGGTVTIEREARKLHLVSGDWYRRGEGEDQTEAPTRPLRGSLFSGGGYRVFLGIDYFE
jgi:hypothetical protein